VTRASSASIDRARRAHVTRSRRRGVFSIAVGRRVRDGAQMGSASRALRDERARDVVRERSRARRDTRERRPTARTRDGARETTATTRVARETTARTRRATR